MSVLMKHVTYPHQLNIPLTMEELELIAGRDDMDGMENEVMSTTRSQSDTSLEDVINTVSCVPGQDTLLSDIRDQGVSATFQSELDVTDIKHRFL